MKMSNPKKCIESWNVAVMNTLLAFGTLVEINKIDIDGDECVRIIYFLLKDKITGLVRKPKNAWKTVQDEPIHVKHEI